MHRSAVIKKAVTEQGYGAGRDYKRLSMASASMSRQ
jgi:hypothetical protein